MEYEVNKKQYELAIKHFSGIIFHRNENGKFYIKIGIAKYEELIKQTLGIK